MAKNKGVLGRGLGALLSGNATAAEAADLRENLPNDDGRSVGTICKIDIAKVSPNPFQPRVDFNPQALEELKHSILEHGVIQPITVRRVGERFELISGERRVRASIDAGLTDIPAYILDVNSDRGMLEIALIENVQRENLNPIEIALGYQRLIKECMVEALRALTYRAVEMYVSGKDVTRLASMAKLKCGRLSREVTDACLQYWGGMGFMNETHVSRAYRDFRLTSIGGGADEVMLMVLCKMMGILPGQRKGNA